MSYRRGFKSEAHSIATEIRAELDLRPLDRLDPWRLAEHLEIPIHSLSEFRVRRPGAVSYLLSIEPESFSAMTVFKGRQRLIVHNDAHNRSRQANDIVHELAHAILMHPPTPAINDRGCRNWNQDIEDEAQFLSGALLVTPEAAIRTIQNGLSLPMAAERYGVSPSLMQYRINVTGARKRVERLRGIR